MPTATALPINTSASALQMANEIFGAGVSVNSATYSGDAASSGIFSSGDTIGAGVTPGDTGVILSTGLATGFTNNSGTLNTNEETGRSTDTAGGINGDSDFDTLAGSLTRDASFLEVNFTPTGDQVTIDFVLSSEEYPEYINSIYNDVVGVWVNGNPATISIGNGTASIGNINGVGGQQNVYNDNSADAFNTEMDGFTITLTFVAPVNTGVPNTLKIGVADVGDANFDTNLLIAGGSVQSTIVAQDDTITMPVDKDRTLDVLDNDSSTGGTLSITQINGQTATVGVPILLATGQSITLNADGTLTVSSDGDDETVYFNYTIQDTSGNTDTAIVEVVQTPCFTEGTLIATPTGEVPIEKLAPGMQVLTRDDGPQTIRWIGNSVVDGSGEKAPIAISKGQFGATRDLLVSPQHRIVLEGYMAELLFGEAEVLVKAKDLINDATILRRPVPQVRYFHMLFDSHQIITANGVDTESYLPGDQTLPGFEDAVRDEIISLFPQLAGDPNSYGPAARPVLRQFEAAPLLMALAA